MGVEAQVDSAREVSKMADCLIVDPNHLIDRPGWIPTVIWASGVCSRLGF